MQGRPVQSAMFLLRSFNPSGFLLADVVVLDHAVVHRCALIAGSAASCTKRYHGVYIKIREFLVRYV